MARKGKEGANSRGTSARMEQETSLKLAHLVRPAEEVGRDNSHEQPTPGLLLLHGRGADEADLMGLVSALDTRLTVVSPRAPFRFGPGFAWFGTTPDGGQDSETLRASLEVARQFIEEMLLAYSIDPGQLFVMGFSQGAVMSAGLAMTMPDIRGVVMHSGYMPGTANVEGTPALLDGKPFFVAHGTYDDLVPVSWGRSAAEYLEEQGAKVTYNEYPIGHSISEESLYELSEWLSRELDRAEQEAKDE